MSDDDIHIVASDQIRAFMTAIRAGDLIQEPLEVILNDNAEGYLKKLSFLEVMGLRQGTGMYDRFRYIKRAGALQRSTSAADMHVKMRMIRGEAEGMEYVEAGGDGPAAARNNTVEDQGETGGEDVQLQDVGEDHVQE